MLKYIIKRLGYTVLVLLGVTVVVFFLLRLAPGSPARLILGEEATEEQVMELEAELGLDKPAVVQYYRFIKGVAQGDLGNSIYFKMPCWTLIKQRLPATGMLAMASVVFALIVSIPLGIISGVRRGSFVDLSAMVVALLGQSISNVWLGLLMILVFAVKLGWLPVMGYGRFSNVIMPAVAMGAATAALLTRLLRSSMVDVLQEDYITATYARGISKYEVIGKYAMRNAILPFITVMGVEIGRFLGGAVVSEQIFAWPGLGVLTVTAINMRDFPLVQAILLVTSAMFVLIQLVVDIIYKLVDPRLDFN